MAPSAPTVLTRTRKATLFPLAGLGWLVVSTVVLSACGTSGSSSVPAEGGGGYGGGAAQGGGAGASNVRYDLIRPLSLDACLPAQLASSLPTGFTGCRILFVGVSGGCGQEGLSPASSTDIDGVTARLAATGSSLPPGDVCQLAEVAAAQNHGAGCSSDASTGWCYVLGPCSATPPSTCTQSICPSSAFQTAHMSYSEAAIACT